MQKLKLPPSLQEIREMRSSGKTWTEISELTKVPRSTLYTLHGKNCLDIIPKRLSDRQKQVLAMKKQNMSFTEIAKKLNISRQAAFLYHKRAQEKGCIDVK